MKKTDVLSAVAGALLITIAADASADCQLQATSGSTIDERDTKIAATAQFTAAELERQYGAPLKTKVLSDIQHELVWSLSSGTLNVVANRATGAVTDVKWLAANSPVESLLSCNPA